MIKGVIAALAALTLAVPQVHAHRASSTNPHTDIVNAVADTGWMIQQDTRLCKEQPTMYGYVSPNDKRFVICADNIPNATMFYTTIRHEAIHIAQICKGENIHPDKALEYVLRAQDEGWNILSYPPQQWDMEGEARVLANELTAQEITDLVTTYCP